MDSPTTKRANVSSKVFVASPGSQSAQAAATAAARTTRALVQRLTKGETICIAAMRPAEEPISARLSAAVPSPSRSLIAGTRETQVARQAPQQKKIAVTDTRARRSRAVGGSRWARVNRASNTAQGTAEPWLIEQIAAARARVYARGPAALGCWA